MDGLLVINKERGFTSFDVIAKLRTILGQKKIGHLGTLDPEAEGVLPIVLGKATRLAELLSEGDKIYRTTLLLGVTTDTQDTTGRLLKYSLPKLDEETVRQAILSFEGEQDQLPPMVSAKKVNGRKLVDLARKGLEVERKPVRIVIHSIEIQDVALPRIRLRVRCSKGTYIRTLCHDIGEKLGCGAAMESLVREESAGCRLEEAFMLDEVEALFLSGKLPEHLHSLPDMLSAYPAFYCRPEADRKAENGNRLKLMEGSVSNKPDAGGLLRVFSSEEKLIGLFSAGEKGQLLPGIMLNQTEEEERRPLRGSVISLGKFDGLHIGHQEIIRRMLELAEADKLRPVLFSFTTPPEALTLGRAEKLLMTASEKRSLALKLGIRGIREVRFTEDIRSMKAIDFLRNVLIGILGMRHIVVGPDCCFGYGREGNIEFLKSHAEELGYGVTVVEKVKLHDEIVSSTRIKQLLSEGDLKEAGACLGRPFSFSGRVCYGARLGHELGYPTINLEIPSSKFLPPFGVYASRTAIEGHACEGMSNLGCKPSVTQGLPVKPGLETHLFREAGELYGQEIRTELLGFVRKEKRFGSPEELREQLKRDEEAIKACFELEISC
ncbi:MAG: tRNA pseudouridine(55) synthase TruB [Lachnospiraceae bacterium]|nr:tRNA pseudouridine(55) synthase TruB [Lachnospiraceae bacterium]